MNSSKLFVRVLGIGLSFLIAIGTANADTRNHNVNVSSEIQSTSHIRIRALLDRLEKFSSLKLVRSFEEGSDEVALRENSLLEIRFAIGSLLNLREELEKSGKITDVQSIDSLLDSLSGGFPFRDESGFWQANSGLIQILLKGQASNPSFIAAENGLSIINKWFVSKVSNANKVNVPSVGLPMVSGGGVFTSLMTGLLFGQVVGPLPPLQSVDGDNLTPEQAQLAERLSNAFASTSTRKGDRASQVLLLYLFDNHWRAGHDFKSRSDAFGNLLKRRKDPYFRFEDQFKGVDYLDFSRLDSAASRLKGYVKSDYEWEKGSSSEALEKGTRHGEALGIAASGVKSAYKKIGILAAADVGLEVFGWIGSTELENHFYQTTDKTIESSIDEYLNNPQMYLPIFKTLIADKNFYEFAIKHVDLPPLSDLPPEGATPSKSHQPVSDRQRSEASYFVRLLALQSKVMEGSFDGVHPSEHMFKRAVEEAFRTPDFHLLNPEERDLTPTSDQEKQALEEDRLKESVRTYKAVDTSLNVLGAFTGKNRDLQGMLAIAKAANEIRYLVDTMKDAKDVPGIVAAVVQLGLQLGDIFGNHSPSAQELILEELGEIKKQVARVETELAKQSGRHERNADYRVQDLHQALNLVERRIKGEFEQSHARMRSVESSLGQLLAGLVGTQRHSDLSKTLSNQKEAWKARQELKGLPGYSNAMNGLSEFRRDSLSTALNRVMNEEWREAVTGSRTPEVIGAEPSGLGGEGSDVVQGSLLNDHGVPGYNLAALAALLKSEASIDITPPPLSYSHTLSSDTQEMLNQLQSKPVNLDHWARHANHIKDLLRDAVRDARRGKDAVLQCRTEQDGDLTQLSTVIDMGSGQLKKIGEILPRDSRGRASPTRLLPLFEAYEASVKEVSSRVAGELTACMDREKLQLPKQNSNLDRQELARSLVSRVRVLDQGIGACQSYAQGKGYGQPNGELKFETRARLGLLSRLEEEVLLALRDNPQSYLEVCYEDMDLDTPSYPAPEVTWNEDVAGKIISRKTMGNMAFTLKVSLRNPTEDEIVVDLLKVVEAGEKRYWGTENFIPIYENRARDVTTPEYVGPRVGEEGYAEVKAAIDQSKKYRNEGNYLTHRLFGGSWENGISPEDRAKKGPQFWMERDTQKLFDDAEGSEKSGKLTHLLPKDYSKKNSLMLGNRRLQKLAEVYETCLAEVVKKDASTTALNGYGSGTVGQALEHLEKSRRLLEESVRLAYGDKARFGEIRSYLEQLPTKFDVAMALVNSDKNIQLGQVKKNAEQKLVRPIQGLWRYLAFSGDKDKVEPVHSAELLVADMTALYQKLREMPMCHGNPTRPDHMKGSAPSNPNERQRESDIGTLYSLLSKTGLTLSEQRSLVDRFVPIGVDENSLTGGQIYAMISDNLRFLTNVKDGPGWTKEKALAVLSSRTGPVIVSKRKDLKEIRDWAESNPLRPTHESSWEVSLNFASRYTALDGTDDRQKLESFKKEKMTEWQEKKVERLAALGAEAQKLSKLLGLQMNQHFSFDDSEIKENSLPGRSYRAEPTSRGSLFGSTSTIYEFPELARFDRHANILRTKLVTASWRDDEKEANELVTDGHKLYSFGLDFKARLYEQLKQGGDKAAYARAEIENALRPFDEKERLEKAEWEILKAKLVREQEDSERRKKDKLEAANVRRSEELSSAQGRRFRYQPPLN